MFRNLSCGKKIVLIAGESGSGKTTFANLLSKELENCPVIAGDQYMQLAFQEYKEELSAVVGRLDYGEDGHIMARSFYLKKEDFDCAVSIIAPYINRHICDEIRRHVNHYNVFIAEWSHIHSLPIWKQSELRFIVIANDAEKKKRLLARDKDGNQDLPMETEARIDNKLRSGRINNYDNDVILINNDEDIESLRQRAKKYAEIINSEKRFYFVTGQHGCGKTFLCQMLTNNREGILAFDCGPEMRLFYKENNGTGKLSDWIKKYNTTNGALEAEKQVVKRLNEKVSNSKSTIVVVIGVRSMQHVHLICDEIGIPRLRIIFIECTFGQRRQHIEQREQRSITADELKKMDEHDLTMGLVSCKEYVIKHPETCTIIHNDENAGKACAEIERFIDVSI